jgi:ABC-type multidrug transport system fused ATPase/permease subunit
MSKVEVATTNGNNQKKHVKPKLSAVWPEIMALIRPRRKLLFGAFLVMLVNRAASLVLPISFKPLIDLVFSRDRIDLLPMILAAVLGATLLQGITSYILTQTLSKAGQRLIAELRIKLQEHIGMLPISYYDENRVGILVTRIITDVEGVRNIIGTGVLDFVGGLLTAIFAFAYLVHYSLQMTIVTTSIMIVFALVIRQTFTLIRPMLRERSTLISEVTGRLTESLGGIRVVKGYHAEAYEALVFTKGVNTVLQNVMRSLTAQSLMTLSSTVILGVVGAVVMYMGSHLHVVGRLTTGDYFSYVMLLAFLNAPIVQLVSIGTQLTEALVGLDRTREVFAEAREDVETNQKIRIPAIEGFVRFEKVSFSYVPEKLVLQEISFEAKPGMVTAIVGSSGSGKSTIVNLICAFHMPNSGRISVDNFNLAEVSLSDYRSQLGVVLQETFLFDGTIRENVMFSRRDATQEEFEEACQIARVDEFSSQFAAGYETLVGERGIKLSGGQRQRLSIARAILADPRILILDEATSSLDSESEAMIQQGLNFLTHGRTTFVIAHRLSTIRKADQILVVEKGRIVERGTHDLLYKLSGRYTTLYDRQYGLETNLFLAPGENN